MTYPIKLGTYKDAIRLSEIASRQNFDMRLSCGTDSINARSLLGLFEFIGKSANLIAPDHADYNSFAKVIRQLSL